MPQSDGKNKLKRFEIEFKGKTFKFNINPEEYVQEEPSRSTVTQTVGGAWVDDFGSGLPNIFIKGTTGFQNGLGVKKFKELRNMVRDYYDDNKPGQEVKDYMTLHNYTDGESWIVHTDPSGIKLLRSKSAPLLFMYEMRFICLRPANFPDLDKIRDDIGDFFRTMSIQGEIENARNTVGEILSLQPGTYPDSTLLSFSSSLDVLYDGTILGYRTISPFSQTSEEDEQKFEPILSKLSRENLATIKQGNVETSIKRKEISDKIDYVRNKFVSSEILTAYKYALLEAYSILESDAEELRNNVSEEDVNRFINNIRWLAEELFKKRDDTIMDIIMDLRGFERSAKRLLKTVYRTPYSSDLAKYKGARG